MEKVLGCYNISGKDITEYMAKYEVDEKIDTDIVKVVTQREIIEEKEEYLDGQDDLIPQLGRDQWDFGSVQYNVS